MKNTANPRHIHIFKSIKSILDELASTFTPTEPDIEDTDDTIIPLRRDWAMGMRNGVLILRPSDVYDLFRCPFRLYLKRSLGYVEPENHRMLRGRLFHEHVEAGLVGLQQEGIRHVFLEYKIEKSVTVGATPGRVRGVVDVLIAAEDTLLPLELKSSPSLQPYALAQASIYSMLLRAPAAVYAAGRMAVIEYGSDVHEYAYRLLEALATAYTQPVVARLPDADCAVTCPFADVCRGEMTRALLALRDAGKPLPSLKIPPFPEEAVVYV